MFAPGAGPPWVGGGATLLARTSAGTLPPWGRGDGVAERNAGGQTLGGGFSEDEGLIRCGFEFRELLPHLPEPLGVSWLGG
jgi:hypothetical protein